MTPTPSDAPVRLGRYEVLAELAVGGMASVHMGRQIGAAGFARIVAIKRLHPHLVMDEDFVAMFLDEARLAARIRHPHVVDVYDVESDAGELFIVMQYVEGVSLSMLKRLLGRQRQIPLGLALRAVHEALQGLDAAHELKDDAGANLGLVHRDVSPHNVLVGTDGLTRVTDFGIAKAAGRLAATREGVLKGKLPYLAPEQLAKGNLDRRVDVYAAGIVLWEAITGHALFRGANDVETIRLVTSKVVPPPSHFVRDLPPALDAICLRALSRDPTRRFPTAAAFADAVEDAFGQAFMRPRDVGKFVEAAMGTALEQRRTIARTGVAATRLRLGEPLAAPENIPSLPPTFSGVHVAPEAERPVRPLALVVVGLITAAVILVPGLLFIAIRACGAAR